MTQFSALIRQFESSVHHTNYVIRHGMFVMPTDTNCVVAELSLKHGFVVHFLILVNKVLVAQLVIAKEVDKNPSVPSSTSVRAVQ